MQVLASGQAGIFAIQTANGFVIERVDTGDMHPADSRDIAYYFNGYNDVISYPVKDVTDARKASELSWAADRAVRLFIILLDPNETPDDLAEVGEALDELLEIDGVGELLEGQLFAAPLPQPINVQAIVRALADAPLSRALLEQFLQLQPVIGRVRSAFERIEDELFEDQLVRSQFLEAAIDRGCFRSLVNASASGAGIDGALFRLYSDLRGLNNHRAIVQRWTESFDRAHYNLEPQSEPEERGDVRHHSTGVAGYQAFQRAMQQQAEIVERIRAGDFDTARRFAQELVAEQQQSSSPEHIAKSLTNLSQQAKVLEVSELALEWARQAVEIKADDATALAQLADLLMRVGRYTEAHQNLDLAQSYGDQGFAASGRARILRYKGQYGEALAAYQRAHSQFSHDYDRAHFNLAGIAECLRDMDQLEDALAAYDDAIRQHPYVAALHSGRAATLVEMGDFQDALVGYQTALRLDNNDVVPRNGIASLHRRAGNFELAESMFREIIIDYPFNTYSQGGLVSCLRDLGRFEEAIAEARKMVEYFPGSSDSFWSLADAQIDALDFEGAKETLKFAIEQFPSVAGLRTGLARVEKARGSYADALALYDEAARYFPSNAWIQVGRADMLRRLGNLDEALRIYEHSFRQHPKRLSLKNAVASIFIHQRRFADALDLLTVDEPRTADDWRNFVIRGLLDSERGQVEAARERFEWGIGHCQFRRERNMLRAALSRLQIQNGEPEAAIETAQECIGDVTELLKFHASATLADKGPARILYERLQHNFLPEPYHELRDEIARTYNVIDFPAHRNAAWLLARESEVLLLEAA